MGTNVGSHFWATMEIFKKRKVEGASLQLQHNNLGREKEEHATIQVEPDPTQMQGVAEQSSCSISRSMDESESGSSIMFYTLPIILVVAGILLGLHLFKVI
eukprot:TRINITY_DN20947_c1_g1_i5.p2 TRINITY_DN20947_c1_g1~~TRINITY_DN20947_c1_g1_i5.p2  ORF type:complete len:101 (-),score=17.13 TRINITY_DN20947_c1_g1_i5:506-808(-)